MTTIKTVIIGGKVSDMCHATLRDENNQIIESHDGYVPQVGVFNDGSDYLYLTIDNATGLVKGWVSLTTLKRDDDAD